MANDSRVKRTQTKHNLIMTLYTGIVKVGTKRKPKKRRWNGRTKQSIQYRGRNKKSMRGKTIEPPVLTDIIDQSQEVFFSEISREKRTCSADARILEKSTMQPTTTTPSQAINSNGVMRTQKHTNIPVDRKSTETVETPQLSRISLAQFDQ